MELTNEGFIMLQIAECLLAFHYLSSLQTFVSVRDIIDRNKEETLL